MSSVDTQSLEAQVVAEANVEVVNNNQPGDQTIPNSVSCVSSDGNDLSNSTGEVDRELVKCTLEAIASTGIFRNDWSALKKMLFFQLKQVLSEYPEAKADVTGQNVSAHETFSEIEKSLHQALERFDDGPPFTLQRLCEILLSARTIYPNLSKLALALEKNLLVTSTLSPCTEPLQIVDYSDQVNEEQKPDDVEESKSIDVNSVENGAEATAVDKDEVMAEMEENEAVDSMVIDVHPFEEIVPSSNENHSLTGNS